MPVAKTTHSIENRIAVALLTGGRDRPYVFGLATALISEGVSLDVIGSTELDFPEFHHGSGVSFLNLRGNQKPNSSFWDKACRVLKYYAELIRYAAKAKPPIFHIVWNNKFEIFDRTLLMLYYKLLKKKIAITAHNVNAGKRDSRDTFVNRLTLRMQYRLSDHLFVHTEKMKRELADEFCIQPDRVSVIPFGINDSVPHTRLTPAEAKHRLGIHKSEKTVLFFGNITPYKGLEYLITAFREIAARRSDYRLLIAGMPVRCKRYWTTVREMVWDGVNRGQVLLRAEHIPDDEVEVYFKAADVLVLPYRHIYESGALFTGYSFGLPTIATDVGSMRDEIVEGKTGYVVRPENPNELADAIVRYFASDLYSELNNRRDGIREYAAKRHSWEVVGEMTWNVYSDLLQTRVAGRAANEERPQADESSVVAKREN